MSNLNDFEEQYYPLEKSLYLTAISYMKNTEDAKDAVQEAALAGFQSYGTLRDKTQFKSWIARILINKCLDSLRRKKVQADGLKHIIDSENLFYDIPLAEIEMMDIICRLPMKLRPYITLRFYQGLTFEEVSKVLKVPVSTAKSRTKKALSELEFLIKE